jgi:hypothetical protein
VILAAKLSEPFRRKKDNLQKSPPEPLPVKGFKKHLPDLSYLAPEL